MALLAIGTVLLARPALPAPAEPRREHVDVIEVNGLIDPVTLDFVAKALDVAQAERALALVLQVDSPGVVAPAQDYRALLRRIGPGAPVPVIVWVGPAGAQAGGRVAELLRTAQLVLRSPGSHIEAEAFLPPPEVAPTLGDVIVQLDGKRLVDGGPVLHTARVVTGGAEPRREPIVAVRFAKPTLAARLLHTAASPPVAYLLLLVALLLALFEFFTAGIGIAAAVAAACGVLGAYGLAVLPARWWAVTLLVVAFFGFAVDVQAGSPRAWTVIGTVALGAGSLRLYEGVDLSLVPTVAGVLGVVLAVVAGMPAMIRSRFSTPTIGRESLLGAVGAAATGVDPDGTVELHGAPWRARTNRATPIPAGDPIRVVGIDGLVLEVEPLEGAAKDAGH